jgi:hypothetical protein
MRGRHCGARLAIKFVANSSDKTAITSVTMSTNAASRLVRPVVELVQGNDPAEIDRGLGQGEKTYSGTQLTAVHACQTSGRDVYCLCVLRKLNGERTN